VDVTAGDLRQYYATLSDEMLQEIDPTDLTEIARKCYHDEVAKRAVTAEPVFLEDEEDGDIEELVEVEPDWLEHGACVCSYTAVPGSNRAPEAERARDVLLASGVPCHLSLLSPDPQNQDAPVFDEYRVLVPESLNLKAISVLDKEIFNPELEADWRTLFATLSDEQLKALKPEVVCAGLLDRVDRLTRVYKDEIARRNLR
jgi:hypothetical protein